MTSILVLLFKKYALLEKKAFGEINLTLVISFMLHSLIPFMWHIILFYIFPKIISMQK